MKGHHILNLFLAMATIIFVTAYVDRFESIDTFFYYFFWWLVIGLVVMILFSLLIRKEKGNDND